MGVSKKRIYFKTLENSTTQEQDKQNDVHRIKHSAGSVARVEERFATFGKHHPEVMVKKIKECEQTVAYVERRFLIFESRCQKAMIMASISLAQSLTSFSQAYSILLVTNVSFST